MRLESLFIRLLKTKLPVQIKNVALGLVNSSSTQVHSGSVVMVLSECIF